MKKKIFPFIAIGVMAALFNIMQIGMDWPARTIVGANVIFAACNIMAAVMSFKNREK